MRFLRLPKNKYIIRIIIFVLIIALVNYLGCVFNIKYISVFQAVEEAGNCEIKNELLIKAMDYVGVCSPKDAAIVWSKGLMERNAAMQYSQMNKNLKDKYKSSIKKDFPNWVTGMSSPWIFGYEITQSEKTENIYVFDIIFITKTSTGPAGNYNASLTVGLEDDFWRIIRITSDKGLYPYTGFDLDLY